MEQTIEQMILASVQNIEARVNKWPETCHSHQQGCSQRVHALIDDVEDEVSVVKVEIGKVKEDVAGTKRTVAVAAAIVGLAVAIYEGIFK